MITAYEVSKNPGAVQLALDSPEGRKPVQRMPSQRVDSKPVQRMPSQRVDSKPVLGGLHHEYRWAA